MELLVSTLEAVGAPVSREGLLTPSTARTDEAHRKCPVCGRGMNKTWLGNTKKALIDSCPIGDGLWFDSGELQHVLAHVKPPDSQESEDVISFLSGAFQSTYGEEKGG
jgi:Zn-finger nucleic acid-binding protein